MNKNLIKKYISKLDDNQFIKPTNKTLLNIINIIKPYLPKKINYKIDYKNISSTNNILEHIDTNDFIHETISNYINNNLKYHYNYAIVDNKNNININLNYYSDDNKIPHSFFDNLIQRILLLFNCFNIKNKNSDIFIYDVPINKQLDSSDIFLPVHINSGYSIPYTGKIVIFRKEELYKVLIHELLHIFHFEINEPSNDCGIYCSLYSITSDVILVNEAVVELYAVIFNTILFTLKMYKKININKITEILNIELHFNLYQIAKILNHSKFKSFDDFLCKNCNNNFIKQKKTNIISYILIKTILLFNLNFITNITDRDTIDLLVKKYINKPSFINIINYYMNHINKYGLIDNNLRMCLFS